MLIAIARKYLPCIFSSSNSFICESNVHFFLSIHLFSTSRVKRLIPRCRPEIYDVLVLKYQFLPELASQATSHLPKLSNPQNVDSILSFLKESRFTSEQLQKMVGYSPRILGFTIGNFKSKLKLFQDLGLSSSEIAKMISSSPGILHSSMKNKIIPSLSLLKGLLGSNENVARLVRKSSWFVRADLENSLMPNVEILKSCGVSMERILHFLYVDPRCFLLKPDIMRKSVDRALQIGISPTKLTFIYAARVFACTSQGMWDVKLQTLRDLGFSDDDIFTMFRKSPCVFSQSTKKIKNVTELLLTTGKYSISNIVTVPSSLGCSIEKRCKPRLQILGLLETRNLNEKLPSLSEVALFTDDRFFNRYVRPYYDEIGKECITKMYALGPKTDEA